MDGILVLVGFIVSTIIAICILSGVITNSVKNGIIQAYYHINYKNQQLTQQQNIQYYSDNSQP